MEALGSIGNATETVEIWLGPKWHLQQLPGFKISMIANNETHGTQYINVEEIANLYNLYIL